MTTPLELARSSIRRHADGIAKHGEHETAEHLLAREVVRQHEALQAMEERVRALEAVARQASKIGHFLVCILPINLDGNMRATIDLRQSRNAIQMLGALIQDADALTIGEAARDTTPRDKEASK